MSENLVQAAVDTGNPVRVEARISKRHAILARYREQMGWTQTRMAREVGINLASYNGYERFRSVPGEGAAKKLADFMGLSVSQLFPPGMEQAISTGRAHTIFRDMEIPDFVALSDRVLMDYPEDRPQMLPETAAEAHSIEAATGRMMSMLTDREQTILRMLYLGDEGRTMDSVGRELRISGTRVAQIHGKIVHRLRREFGPDLEPNRSLAARRLNEKRKREKRDHVNEIIRKVKEIR